MEKEGLLERVWVDGKEYWQFTTNIECLWEGPPDKYTHQPRPGVTKGDLRVTYGHPPSHPLQERLKPQKG